jgi:hypothetical protein
MEGTYRFALVKRVVAVTRADDAGAVFVIGGAARQRPLPRVLLRIFQLETRLHRVDGIAEAVRIPSGMDKVSVQVAASRTCDTDHTDRRLGDHPIGGFVSQKFDVAVKGNFVRRAQKIASCVEAHSLGLSEDAHSNAPPMPTAGTRSENK